MFTPTEAKGLKRKDLCINCSIYMIILSVTVSLLIIMLLVWLRNKRRTERCCNSEISNSESSSSSDSDDQHTRDFEDAKEEKILSDSLNAYAQTLNRYKP